MTIAAQRPRLRVAIVGAGPGGLAATIFLGRLDFVDLAVYDQATILREIGAGISINQNTWRLLKLLGAAEQIEQHSKRADGRVDSEHRNGHTAEVLAVKYQTKNPDDPARSRIERYKLQQALLSQIPEGVIQLGKKLAKIEEDGKWLEFADGSREGPFDLIVGADGIRSAVRQHAFPSHKLSYTGKVAYRTLIPAEQVAHIPNLPRHAGWWHTRNTHVYTDFLDNGLFEIATRAIEGEEYGAKVSWGREVDKAQVVGHYDGYCETVRQVIAVPDKWLEFALFGGPRLDTVVSGNIALLGDASHPLSGAFGSGAAFAFEDAYILANVIERGLPLSTYDEIRAPRYRDLHGVLDLMGSNAQNVASLNLDDNEHIAEAYKRNWQLENAWIYTYDITSVWSEYLGIDPATS